jgi:AP-1 complex subunit beta-1
MTHLPPALLEQLLMELSTLASVYHKPPESFVGKGRFGADEIQRAAIQEQRQNAAENPIAASAAAAAANGGASSAAQNNIENLLDIDFDGAAPASQEQATGSEGPSRTASPSVGGPSGGMADMMSMFDAPAPQNLSSTTQAAPSGGMNDLMNGFEGLNFGGQPSTEPLPAAMQLQNAQGGQAPQAPKKDSEDLLGLL